MKVYSFTEKKYKDMLRKFYFNNTKYISVIILIGIVVAIYLLIIGCAFETKAFYDMIRVLSVVTVFSIGYIIAINSMVKRSLNFIEFNKQSIDLSFEIIDDYIKIYNITNNTTKMIQMKEITKISPIKEYAVITCEFRAAVIVSKEIADSINIEKEEKK